jgi:hypothetical protein
MVWNYLVEWWSLLWYGPVNTPIAQLMTSFALGVLFSPFSSGLFYLTLYIAIYEFLYYVLSGGKIHPAGRIADYDDDLYYAFVRLGVVSASYSGYIIGMTLCDRDPLS